MAQKLLFDLILFETDCRLSWRGGKEQGLSAHILLYNYTRPADCNVMAQLLHNRRSSSIVSRQTS